MAKGFKAMTTPDIVLRLGVAIRFEECVERIFVEQ